MTYESMSKARERIAELEHYVAECKRIELVLKQKTDFIRRIFDSNAASMAVIDAGGRIVDVNETWRRFAIDNDAGDERTWGIGASYFRELTAYGDTTNARDAYDGIRRVQKGVLPAFEIEYPCHSPDVKRWFVMRAVSVTGQPGSVLVSHLDITKLKEAEEELISYRNYLERLVKDRTAELEEKNRKLAEEISERKSVEKEKEKVEADLLQSQKIEALGSFAGGIAHDLNNILSPIVVNSETLLEVEEPGTEAHEMIEQTLEAAYRQRDLIKQIISFSRKGVQKLSPLHVAPLLESTLSFVRSTLPSTIDIRSSINAPNDTVMADSTQIQQVIINLCKNAADAVAPQGGILEVSLSDVHLNENPAMPEIKAGEYLELTFRDTGRGIPPEDLDRIFDPFFTTKPVDKGSGLGLSVVYGILKKHGGAITAESREGKGSRFTAYLPLSDQRPGAHGSGMEDGDEGAAREKILFVDDEQIIVATVGRAMERLGYDVTALENPQEALDLFRKDPEAFDLVITDMTMPGMNGLALGKRIKGLRPGIPVIICTGFSDLIDEEEISEKGFSGLLMKPANTGELKAVIGRALQERSSATPPA